MRSLLLLLFLSSSCATTGVLPRASFYGLRIEARQDTPGTRKLRLDLSMDFQIENPLGIKLTIPKHDFGLLINGEQVAGGRIAKDLKVGARSKKKLTYTFSINPQSKKLREVQGTDAEFSFVAHTDVNLPQRVLQGIQENLGALGDGGKAASALLEGVALPSGSGKALRLDFKHQGRIRIPKLPVFEADAQTPPTVHLTSSGQSLSQVLGPLTEAIGPFAEVIDLALGNATTTQVQIPIRELLQAMGVPANLSGGAVQALNAFLSLNGKSGVANSNSTVTLPIQIPDGVGVLRGFDPQAKNKARAFRNAWRDLSNGPLAGLGPDLSIPTGIALQSPFTIKNPNSFAITAPSFRFSIETAKGKPVATLQTAPKAQIGKNGKGVNRAPRIPANKTRTMVLDSQVHWANLGKPSANTSLRLSGEMVIDLGYGPITLPLSVALPAATR